MSLSLLAIDVGGGTTEYLSYDESISPKNCPRMIVPSRTVLVAEQIREAGVKGRDVFLKGNLMGGGPSTKAAFAHIEKGFKVYSTPIAAKTLNDNLDRVRDRGVRIVEERPEEAVEIDLRDVDLEAVSASFKAMGVSLPQKYAVAVQDHGESPSESNRRFRFRNWESFLKEGGSLKGLAFHDPPAHLTRMLAVKRDLPGAIVADTGGAAILGALEDEEVEEAAKGEGAILINIGNFHTIAFLVRGERVLGLFEHHTGLLDRPKLEALIEKLKQGKLTNEEVFNDGGHGAAIASDIPSGGFSFLAITGPGRGMAKGLGKFASPHGDPMLAGCFGLVRAFKYLSNP